MTPFAVALAWLPAVAFPIVYWRARWYSTAPGRAVMTLSVVIALVMTLAFINRVLDFDLPHWARVLVYLLIAAALWFQLGTLLVVQRTKSRTDREMVH